ncbi:MAG: hypothetical protein ACI8YP_000427 [Algoriphagus sp.]|jgi:hypothetical protein
MDKKIIGRKEKISLPILGLSLVWAKVDTGAYTSSIHAESITVEEVHGKRILSFQPLMEGHKAFTGQTVYFDQFTEKNVKNSFGNVETRYLIETTIKIAGEQYLSEFTLSDRTNMRNAILLGRKTLKNRFFVDVDKVNLARAHRIHS